LTATQLGALTATGFSALDADPGRRAELETQTQGRLTVDPAEARLTTTDVAELADHPGQRAARPAQIGSLTATAFSALSGTQVAALTTRRRSRVITRRPAEEPDGHRRQ
jgi:hypothetical protein